MILQSQNPPGSGTNICAALGAKASGKRASSANSNSIPSCQMTTFHGWSKYPAINTQDTKGGEKIFCFAKDKIFEHACYLCYLEEFVEQLEGELHVGKNTWNFKYWNWRSKVNKNYSCGFGSLFFMRQIYMGGMSVYLNLKILGCLNVGYVLNSFWNRKPLVFVEALVLRNRHWENHPKYPCLQRNCAHYLEEIMSSFPRDLLGLPVISL